jgi:Ca2+-binding EF-hand superfamily protein
LSDRDGGGSISKEELGQLMETLGIHASPDEIDMMVNEIDKNNDGEIQFEGASNRRSQILMRSLVALPGAAFSIGKSPSLM